MGQPGRGGRGHPGGAQPAAPVAAPGQHHHRRRRHRRPRDAAGLHEVAPPDPRPADRLGPGLVRRLPPLHLLLPAPRPDHRLFNAVVTYNVAFKLVTVLGTLTLPVCAWAFGRLAGLRDPGPGCLAAATLPVPLRAQLHHLRREHPVHPGRRVLLLAQPLGRPPLPRRRGLGPADRPAPGPGRRPVRRHPPLPPDPGHLRRGGGRGLAAPRRRRAPRAAPRRGRRPPPAAGGRSG